MIKYARFMLCLLIIWSATNIFGIFGWLFRSDKPEVIPKETINAAVNQGGGVNVLHAPNHNNLNLKVYAMSTSYLMPVFDACQSLRDSLQAHSETAQSWIAKHKKTTGLIGVISLLASVQLYLFYIGQSLRKNFCWSLWQKDKQLELLYKQPQELLARDILTEIQRAYTSIHNPTDFVTPLTSFLAESSQEEKYLIHYKKIVNFGKACNLHKILIYDEHLLASISMRLARLSYIKNSFLTWLATYKINQTQQELPSNLLRTLKKYKLHTQ